LVPPSIQLACERGHENEDQRESDVNENVIAVHGSTS
jgi:hypothetical protein